MICQCEQIATAGLESEKIVTKGDGSKGELVLSNLNSSAPLVSGNLGGDKLQVIRKSNDTIWLAGLFSNSLAHGVVTATLFFKSGIVTVC